MPSAKEPRILTVVPQLTLAALLGCFSLIGEPGDGNPSFGAPQPPPVRSLADAPTPESFVAPGIEGLYARLRAGAKRSQDGACVSGVTSRPSKKPLAPYIKYDSPATPPNPSAFNLRQIVVKFVEGSSVRLRGRQLRQVKVPDPSSARKRLARSGIDGAEVARELRAFNKAVKAMRAVVGRATPQVAEKDLLRLRRCAEGNTRHEMADLNLFYFVHLPEIDGETAQRFLNRLRTPRIVEVAYFQPIPFDAADIPPPTTIDVTPSQGYFRPAPTGIDVDFARHFRLGRGNTIRVADIEAGWYDHEEFPDEGFRFGVNWGDSHGTAVLGELEAEENGFGANGIAPNAMVGLSSVTNLDPTLGIYFYSVGSALVTTLRALRPGDIALIEQQFQHWSDGFACNPAMDPCNGFFTDPCSNPPWVAVEEFALEHAAITNVTGGGVVVVEAAGNGRMPVTPASSVDSGAIVVGASNTALTPMCWSNFGSRVNVHGWGMNVGTTGYGLTGASADPALRANGGDPSQWYTRSFSGTSSASPIVAGAAAIIQSTRIEVGLPVLTSVDMRDLLASTGTPQAAGSTPNIGPLPNLRAAIARYRPDRARFVNQTSMPGNIAQTSTPSVMPPSTTFTLTGSFANSGGVTWSGAHTLSVAPSAQSGIQEFHGPTFSLGAPGAEVFPEDQVVRTFSVTAPSQPGTYRLSIVLKNGLGQVLASSPGKQVVVANATFDDARIAITSAPGSLLDGQSATVTVQVTNSGSTTWSSPTYVLGLQRGMRVSLPQQSASLPGAVGPGAGLSLSFTISCSGSGQGWFSVQMRGGATGTFGQQASRTVVCH